MPRVVVVDRAGGERALSAPAGISILDFARLENLALEGTCGGQMACATCHVLIAREWQDQLPPASPEETEMLSLSVRPRRASRLGCQIELTEALDGLRFEVIGE